MVAEAGVYNETILKINLFLLGPDRSPHNPKYVSEQADMHIPVKCI